MDDTEAPTPGICLIHRSLRRFILSNCSGELRNLANFDRSLQESTAQKKTVETRLQSLTRKGITNLADLLLSRGAGIFDWYHRSLANYHICDRHQQELEDNQPWRSSWTYARVTTPKKKKATERIWQRQWATEIHQLLMWIGGHGPITPFLQGWGNYGRLTGFSRKLLLFFTLKMDSRSWSSSSRT